MANGPDLSTAKGGEIYVGNEIRDSLSLLDVLCANQFEGESFCLKHLEQTEENFYTGAPPEWLNFHISEQATEQESHATGTPFIRRDGFENLEEQIRKRKRPGTSTVKLVHQPGCGGTTLAMQVMWKLRKTFRCAVLTGSTSDITNVAKEVVHLFTAGSRGKQRTVLLLLNDEQILENLQDSIMKKIAEQQIVTHMPVVILLTCVRKDEVLQGDQGVVLQKVLSDSEKQKFNEKKEELHRRYGDKCKQFHGFNIMQTNFSQAYVKQACAVISTVQRTNRPQKTQLAAFLSLLNAYVPGSYLLESQCLDFFKHEDYIHGDLSLEDRMEPFSHLIITFQQDMSSEKKVSMAHPMIAQCCTELMAQAGVTRSDTARNLLTCFCRDEVPPFLLGFIKDMLTKREMKKEENPTNSEGIKEDKAWFSRLILDIQKIEGKKQSASILQIATNKFDQNPFFPQALARVYYIELNKYNQAEMWAMEAKQRDPQNSFVADTLGQVYKNHLKNKDPPTEPREILQLATKAIQAFKHEEQLAEKEQDTDMKENGMTKVSHVFNTRGQFGYLQVCKLVYDHKYVSMGSDLINRDEVEKKCAFFDKYLTYSKPNTKRDDPSYISGDTSECYKNYVGDSPPKHFEQKGADFIQKLKQMLANTSAGVPSCLDREYTESELKEIITWWEEIFQHSSCKSLIAFGQKMPLSPTDEPELHLLTLLLYWPTDSEDKCDFDLCRLIQSIRCSYEHTYKKYFRSRYLRPLFFIGKGQDLNRIVLRKVLEGLLLKQTNGDWRNEKIFEDPMVQEYLHKVEGVVRNYKVYVTIGGAQIEVGANLRNSLWNPGQVSFYLGFTIRGPVAFGIHTKTAEKVEISKTDISNLGPTLRFGACCSKMESGDLTKLQPEVIRVDEVHTYSHQSEAGNYECSVSGLRWVCNEEVSFRYQFISWEEHMRRPAWKDCMPAGPLLDITATAGKIEELHLPHWICIEQNSTISDMFAVLHVDTRGVVVEHVNEVTSSHIKFLQPTFTPKGILIRKKLDIPIYCDVLIYKTNKEFLTLDVYLVPRDPALKQEVEKKQNSCGSILILKPGPDKSLQMGENFLLTTDKADANIRPSTQVLRHDSENLYEVFIRNPDSDFSLRLESGQNTVWTCTIHKGDYLSQSSHVHASGQHFVNPDKSN